MPSKKRKIAVNDGKMFELKVKQALEAIGYQVKHDLLISGSQIDLYAEKKIFFLNTV